MNRRWLTVVSLLVPSLALPACGSSNDNSNGSSRPGSFSSGLPTGSTLAGLSDSDWANLCASSTAYFADDDAVNATCRFGGMTTALSLVAFGVAKTDADVQKACTDAYNKCTMAAQNPDAGTDSNTCSKPSAQCTATVGELEACYTDGQTAVKTDYAMIPSCDQLTLATLSNGSAAPQTSNPASCETLQQKCPEAAKRTGQATHL